MPKEPKNKRFILIKPIYAKWIIGLWSLFLVILSPSTEGATQAWVPEKNVELVVGLAPGSFQDHTARMIQKIFQDEKFIPATTSVVNRSGGGGLIAWSYLSQHARDPHFLLITSPTLLTSQIMGFSPLGYKDMTPVATLSGQYVGMAVNAHSSLKNAAQLMERLKKDESSISFASSSRGSNLHILIAMVGKSAGVNVKKLKIAIFQGGGELTTAALGDHVDVIATATSNILPHYQSGKLRLLGIAAPHRLSGALKDVPTWKEQGVDAIALNWSGICAPRSISPAALAAWESQFDRLQKNATWKSDLEKNFQEPHFLNSQQTLGSLKEEEKILRAALTDLGLAK